MVVYNFQRMPCGGAAVVKVCVALVIIFVARELLKKNKNINLQ
jgi:hypothetical protein